MSSLGPRALFFYVVFLFGENSHFSLKNNSTLVKRKITKGGKVLEYCFF